MVILTGRLVWRRQRRLRWQVLLIHWLVTVDVRLDADDTSLTVSLNNDFVAGTGGFFELCEGGDFRSKLIPVRIAGSLPRRF
jgi:hypothetical protein